MENVKMVSGSGVGDVRIARLSCCRTASRSYTTVSMLPFVIRRKF